ncbi:MAG: DUF937 domain-containing protein [Desulfofustis sp.]|nr:DUF937 domain-containing protein [Desulfofustis sp.]MBT8355909.1 DUF937 domain-containing protein [Desulfofustis sp.]NNF45310.1 DUF937 domain-containing protein [Desulfofustis sp.]
MNLNDLIQMGATVFRDSNLSGDAGSNLDIEAITSALSGLTGGSGGFDLNSVVEKFGSSGLGDTAKSWLGDGANQSISPEQLGNALGSEQLSQFASKLGISAEEAAGGLSDALPQMVDKASSGGSLLESLGGVEGVIGMASKLFK